MAERVAELPVQIEALLEEGVIVGLALTLTKTVVELEQTPSSPLIV